MSQFAGKTFLVTGGAGFIGSHLVRQLLERQARVIVVDDFNDFYDPSMKEKNVAPFSHHPGFNLVRADIRQKADMAKVFERFSTDLINGGVIHIAARAGVRPSLLEPELYLNTNVLGTLNLVELAQSHGVKKFIFASSSSVYGDSADKVPFTETQDISKPISPYASTKAMAESLLYTYSHLYDMQVVILRFFTVYGPSQRPDLAIHKFTRLIDQGRPIPMFGDGSTQRDYTYVDDIIQGVLGAIQYEDTPYEIFNLGESQTVSLTTLIQLLEESLHRKALIQKLPLQPGDVPVTYADIRKAQTLLNYRPSTPIETGIPKFVDWYLQQSSLTSASS